MAEITREQISAIRAYYIGPNKEALRYMVISDILYDALPALLDIAEKVIAEPSDPKPTSDLLSRLAEAQRYVNARGWYGLDVLLNEAETEIRRFEQLNGSEESSGPREVQLEPGWLARDVAAAAARIQPKGGDADERSSNNARHATSPGVTAGASEIEELCKRLGVLAADPQLLRRERNDLTEAATLIRRLELQLREVTYSRDTWRKTAEGRKGSFEVQAVERRAAAAEAEVERLTAENAELKAWKKRRQEEDEDEADRREIW